MLVREVMSAPAVVLHEDDGTGYAVDLLLRRGFSSAPVVDAGGALVGVVAETDLLRERVGAGPRALAGAGEVGDVMTRTTVSVSVGADADDAARLLLDHGVRSLPVTEDRRVVGVVARRDLLAAPRRTDVEVRAAVVALLEDVPVGRLTVAVVDGTVTLGTASGRGMQHVAAALARTVPGVTRVVHVADDDTRPRR